MMRPNAPSLEAARAGGWAMADSAAERGSWGQPIINVAGER